MEHLCSTFTKGIVFILFTLALLLFVPTSVKAQSCTGGQLYQFNTYTCDGSGTPLDPKRCVLTQTPDYQACTWVGAACVHGIPRDQSCYVSPSTGNCVISLDGPHSPTTNGCTIVNPATPTPPGATPVPPTPTPVPPPSCPNGSCNAGESCSNCPQDCGTCSTPTPPPGCVPAYSGVQGPTCQNYPTIEDCQAVSNDCKCGSCTGNISYHAKKLALVYEDLNQNGVWDTASEQRLSGVPTYTDYIGTVISCTNAGIPPALRSTYVNGVSFGIDDDWNGGSQWICNMDDREVVFWLGCNNPLTCDRYAQIEHSCMHTSDCGAWPGAIRRFQPNFTSSAVNANQDISTGPVYQFTTHNVENGGQVHRITVTAPSGWQITQVRKQDGAGNPSIPPYGCTAQSCNYDVVFDSAPADGCGIACDANFLTVGMRQVPIPSCTVTVNGANIPLNGTRTITGIVTTTNQGTVSNVKFTIPAASRTMATFIDSTALQNPIDPLVANGTYNCGILTGCTYSLFGYSPNIKGLLPTGATPITVTAYASLTDSRVNTNVGPLGNYECSGTGTVTVNSVAWWQATDADILLNGAFRSSLPSATTRFDLTGPDAVAGVPSYSSVANADLGLGTYPTAISDQRWVVNSNPTLPYPSTNTRFDYAYLTNLGPQVTCPSADLCYNNIGTNVVTMGDLQAMSATAPFRSQGYAWFRRTGDLTLQGGTFAVNRKYVLFVNGNITINNDITLASPGSQSMLIVASGNLTLGSDVAQLDGIYIVGGNFSTGTKSPAFSDDPLIVNGSVVVWGNATLQRNLGNNLNPAESFNYKPQLLVDWPQALSRKLTDWKEVNP